MTTCPPYRYSHFFLCVVVVVEEVMKEMRVNWLAKQKDSASQRTAEGRETTEEMDRKGKARVRLLRYQGRR